MNFVVQFSPFSIRLMNVIFLWSSLLRPNSSSIYLKIFPRPFNSHLSVFLRIFYKKKNHFSIIIFFEEKYLFRMLRYAILAAKNSTIYDYTAKRSHCVQFRPKYLLILKIFKVSKLYFRNFHILSISAAASFVYVKITNM